MTGPEYARQRAHVGIHCADEHIGASNYVQFGQKLDNIGKRLLVAFIGSLFGRLGQMSWQLTF